MPGQGDDLRKITSGEVLPAIPVGAWNTFIDVANAFKKNQLGKNSGASSSRAMETGKVLIHNAGSTNLDRFAVVGIGAPIVLPSDNVDTFNSVVAFHSVGPAAGKFAVLQEPIAKGNVGVAVMHGITPVLLNVAVASNEYADVDGTSNTDLLTSIAGSAQILYKESGTGTGIRGIVRIDNKSRTRVDFLMYMRDGGAGQYQGTIMIGTTTVAAGSDFKAAVGGLPAGLTYLSGGVSYDALCCCRDEFGLAGWRLFALDGSNGGQLYCGDLMGSTSDGKAILFFDAGNAFAFGGAEQLHLVNGDGLSWNRDTTAKSLQFDVITSTAGGFGGTPLARTVIIDAFGNLRTVSADHTGT